MRTITAIITTMCILAVSASASAGELRVPDDYLTIQAAIDAAYDGDTVIVADGTYTGDGNRDIDFLGKAITVKSASGPENCIIDCNGRGRGFYFYSGEDQNSVLDGFTITKGRTSYGGGIRCRLSSPVISNCIITGNNAIGGFTSEGGGIDCAGSSAIITDCIIEGNSAFSKGGGIYCSKSNLVINNSTISENSARSRGGILCEEDCNLTISNCTITRNEGAGVWCDGNLTIANSTISNHSSTGPGGGVYCSGGLIIRDSTISGNTTASYGGGGITCSGSTATIGNCIISDNLAEWGGGIFCHDANLTMQNCVVKDNTVQSPYAYGGGILCSSGSQKITNCTISGNKADYGGAIMVPDANLVMTNCILWDNNAEEGPELYLYNNSNALLRYSCVRGGQDDAYIGTNCTLDWGAGNVDADPCFIEPGYWADANDPNIIVEPNDANAVWIDGDYRLLPSSPCIDTGDPNYIPQANETDLDGKDRIMGGRVDMGAYEFSPPIEARMKLTPQTLNCGGKGKYIKAHIILPEGILAEDIDVNTPAVADPPDIDSEYIKILGGDTGPVKLEIAFDRAAFCEAIGETGEIEVTVFGYLTTGREFYATDTIRIKKTPTRRKSINRAQPARRLRPNHKSLRKLERQEK